MTVYNWAALVVFAVATFLGYKVINTVPSLLHTPLMSGMNAFSGVTLLGCLTATATAVAVGGWLGRLLGAIAIILAMINLVGGFAVTHRMLKMFRSKDDHKKEGDN
ncbi:MAG: NAD(P) transhydrogenase subunit alpha [Candidatus Riflebacteria bacterium]|nr:NAD(P) transhydrogenase subunit alpha [Candidatus Riflebacteria bacterium]